MRQKTAFALARRRERRLAKALLHPPRLRPYGLRRGSAFARFARISLRVACRAVARKIERESKRPAFALTGYGVAAFACFAAIGTAGLPSRSLRSKRRL